MSNAKVAQLILSCLVALSSHAAYAKYFFVAEVGANQGFLSAGLAGDHEVVSWAATMGATPSTENSGFITQLNLKAAATIHYGDEFRILIGPAIYINASAETFFLVPDRYPEGYYPPNAYFFSLNTMLAARNGYFFELSILDYYFEVLSRNPRGSISDTEMVSLGFGKVF